MNQLRIHRPRRRTNILEPPIHRHRHSSLDLGSLRNRTLRIEQRSRYLRLHDTHRITSHRSQIRIHRLLHIPIRTFQEEPGHILITLHDSTELNDQRLSVRRTHRTEHRNQLVCHLYLSLSLFCWKFEI